MVQKESKRPEARGSWVSRAPPLSLLSNPFYGQELVVLLGKENIIQLQVVRSGPALRQRGGAQTEDSGRDQPRGNGSSVNAGGGMQLTSWDYRGCKAPVPHSV